MNKESEKSFSLGRLDIVDLFEWHSTGKLQYRTYFQRQYVWREKDRIELIDTIMQGYPIPAIFICDAQTDYDGLKKTYNVLDGRQRLESIFSYLKGEFSYNGKRFGELNENDKQRVLSYNIALVQMYINPENTVAIKEVFKRLNKASYNLNRIEKQSTQLVEYDFMIISKIVTGVIQFQDISNYLEEITSLFPEETNEEDGMEETGEIDLFDPLEEGYPDLSERIKYICDRENIKFIHELLTGEYIFSKFERQRLINLQYFLNIFSFALSGNMPNRNVLEKQIILLSETETEQMRDKLRIYNLISEILLELFKESNEFFWKNKTNFFTLSTLMLDNPTHFLDIGYEKVKTILSDFQASNSADWTEYVTLTQQAVNDRQVRLIRLAILKKVFA